MKTITMSYDEYKEDIARERENGFVEAIRRIKTAIKEHKKGDDKEASLILIEDFGTPGVELCKALGIKYE